MIKYCGLDGYNNCGEVQMFSHLYQFIEKDEEVPKIILLHAYDICPALVFKGYVFDKKRTWTSIPLTEAEKSKIEGYVGTIQEVDFSEFTNKHDMLEPYRAYISE